MSDQGLQDTGVVKTWHNEEGWGTVALDHVGLTVWVHYRHIVAGPTEYRSLAQGQRVRCHYEVPGQDGYPARAVEVIALLPGPGGVHQSPTAVNP
ncbi:cold-shock protein [Micromonospora sp. NPDC048830]|uniref:cold-shock protein n=1 Tax=Micromonospora sp. NPDC048830 TaxID=3364257 RepID=UPI00371D93D4